MILMEDAVATGDYSLGCLSSHVLSDGMKASDTHPVSKHCRMHAIINIAL